MDATALAYNFETLEHSDSAPKEFFFNVAWVLSVESLKSKKDYSKVM